MTTHEAPAPTPAMPALSRRRPQLVITVGIPGAGKSRWAKRSADTTGAAVIGRDSIREELYGPEYLTCAPDPEKEPVVTDIQHRLVGEALDAGRDVIVDDTNLNPTVRAGWRQFAANHHARYAQVSFWCPLGVALSRNASRSKTISEDAIREMHRRWVEQDGGRRPAGVSL